MPTDNKKKGISIDDLMGISTLKVKRMKATMGKMNDEDSTIPIIEGKILEGDLEGSIARWGLVTEKVVEKIMNSGELDKEGNVILYLPAPDPSKQINWVTFL